MYSRNMNMSITRRQDVYTIHSKKVEGGAGGGGGEGPFVANILATSGGQWTEKFGCADECGGVGRRRRSAPPFRSLTDVGWGVAAVGGEGGLWATGEAGHLHF